jgi:hypothetical protein
MDPQVPQMNADAEGRGSWLKQWPLWHWKS